MGGGQEGGKGENEQFSWFCFSSFFFFLLFCFSFFSFPGVAVASKHAVLKKSGSPLPSASYILGIKGAVREDAEAAEGK